jgi:hypothetical protein
LLVGQLAGPRHPHQGGAHHHHQHTGGWPAEWKQHTEWALNQTNETENFSFGKAKKSVKFKKKIKKLK